MLRIIVTSDGCWGETFAEKAAKPHADDPLVRRVRIVRLEQNLTKKKVSLVQLIFTKLKYTKLTSEHFRYI